MSRSGGKETGPAEPPDTGHDAKRGRSRITRRESTRARERECVRLRSMGWSYVDIAQAVGFANSAGACKAVTRALGRNAAEPTRAARDLELLRLDQLQVRALALVADGDPRVALQAMDRALRVGERRARLLGLDSPVRSERTTRVIRDEVEVTGPDLDREIEPLTGELASLDTLEPAPSDPPPPDPRADSTPDDAPPDDRPRAESAVAGRPITGTRWLTARPQVVMSLFTQYDRLRAARCHRHRRDCNSRGGAVTS